MSTQISMSGIDSITFQNDLTIVDGKRVLRLVINSEEDSEIMDIPWREGMDDLNEITIISAS